MPITDSQKLAAEAQQLAAAREAASQVRLIAGPGTGKSKTIEKRIREVLDAGVPPAEIVVISFTRATCSELRERILRSCEGTPHESAAQAIVVSTMHSLALRILKGANLLNRYPADPVILDPWEQKTIYDPEFATALRITRTRAAEIRLAHDASWQTLDPASLAQQQVTPSEVTGFNAFHSTRTNLYSCVLPGEVIFQCVENFRLGDLQPTQLPAIKHLIVDEFQDLNACDQRFVYMLCSAGATLFVAGDDDQSIYAFRHADPSGIVDFPTRYPSSVTHELTACFRCAPAILDPALTLVSHNPHRQPKSLHSLYGNASPPVQGTLRVWSFNSADDEARAVAESCRSLLDAGMRGNEDQILILLSQANPAAVQLEPITRELANLGIAFTEPAGASLTSNDTLRAVYSILRILRDIETGKPDYLPFRALLCILAGVGHTTAKAIADDCVAHSYNFHNLFLSPVTPSWLAGRAKTAVERVRAIVQSVTAWTLSDTLATRLGDIGALMSSLIFNGSSSAANHQAVWLAFAGGVPDQMTLHELLDLLSANTTDQDLVLDKVRQRLGIIEALVPADKRVRILTMHGAKGLSGNVVFIPSASQEIIPSKRSIQATGLLIEQRRLFYVSLTRARAACIISHATTITGSAAFALRGTSPARFTRSQFLTEMGVPSVNRRDGLSMSEASSIIADIQQL